MKWSVSQGRYVDETQIGGGQTSVPTDANTTEPAAKALLQMFLSNPTGKNASNLLSGYKELSPNESADAQKKKMSKKRVEEVLSQVENSYFGGKNVLSYSYPGNKLRGVQETFNAVALGKNPELSAYLGLRDNLRPTLARAAGDVGNLSGPEQNRAVALIPTATDTPEEAVRKLNQFRTKIGLPEKDYSKYVSIDKLPLPEQQRYYAGKKVFKETTTPLDKSISYIENKSTSQVAPTGTGIYSTVGDIGTVFAPNPIAGGAIAGAGEYANQVSNRGIPKTPEEAKNFVGNPFLNLLGPLGPALLDRTGVEGATLRAAFKGAGLNALFHPIKTLSTLRDLSTAGRVANTGTIVNAGKEFVAGARPDQISVGRNLLKEDIAKYGTGENTPLKIILEEFTKRGKGAYSPKTGDVLTKASAAYNQAIQNALRDTIQQSSPVTGALTKAIGTLMKIKGTGQSIIKKALIPLGLYLGGKQIGNAVGGQ